MGDTIAFYEKNEIREGNYLCSASSSAQLSPRQILNELLTTDDEIRCFCRHNGVQVDNTKHPVFPSIHG